MDGDGSGVRDSSWVAVSPQEDVSFCSQGGNVQQSRESKRNASPLTNGPKSQFRAYKSASFNNL